MRKLMALAIGLLFAGATTSWALFGLEDVSYDGSLEVVGVSENNTVDQDSGNAPNGNSDRSGFTNTRVLVGINMTVTEGVMGRLEFSRTGNQYGTNPNSLTTEQGLIFVQNAYVDIEDVIFGVGARLGRQYVGNAGDLVWNLANVDNDALTTGAIDGLLLTRNWEPVQASYFTGKALENDLPLGNTDADDASPTVSDINVNSFDLIFPTLVPGAKVNLGYLWGVNSSTAGTTIKNKLTTVRLGINGGLQEDMFTYRAEYFVNGGANVSSRTVDYGGTALDLAIAYNSPETQAGTFNLGVGLLLASGDDKFNDNDDDAFHDFGIIGAGSSDRIMGEIFGKSASLAGQTASSALGPANGGGVDTGAQGQGMEVLHLMAKYTPTQILDGKLSAKLDYFNFDTAEDGNTSRNQNGDSWGSEIDLTFGYDHSDNVGIELGYAMFSPGDAWVNTYPTTTAPDDDATKLFARTKIKWGGEE